MDDGRLEFAKDVRVVEFGREFDAVGAAAVGGVEDAVRFRVGLDSERAARGGAAAAARFGYGAAKVKGLPTKGGRTIKVSKREPT